jgi:hypothetical protein
MTFPGSIIFMAYVNLAGSAGSGDQASFTVYIDDIPYISHTTTGSILLGPKTYGAGADIFTSGNFPLKVEIENISGVQNPEAEATFTILKRFR